MLLVSLIAVRSIVKMNSSVWGWWALTQPVYESPMVSYKSAADPSSRTGSMHI